MRSTITVLRSVHMLLALTLLVSGLGGLTLVAPAQAQTLFSLKVNFANKPNPDTIAIPAGYVRDYGLPYGLRATNETGRAGALGPTGLTYGWVNPTTLQPLNISNNGRDRNFSTTANPPLDQRLDTLIHMQADDIGGTFNPGVKTEGLWEIAVPNGAYAITISAGDGNTISATGAQERHTINVEGLRVVDNFVPPSNTAAPAGSTLRFQQGTAQVLVKDGKLTIDAFTGFNTKINYINIDQIQLTPQQLDLQINSGGPELATSMGLFSADQFFNDTDSRALNPPVSTPIEGTTDDPLYQAARVSLANRGTLTYQIPVPGADVYRVRLHFAESFFTGLPGRGALGPNKRVFNIGLEGIRREANFDLYVAGGNAALTAIVKEYEVVVADNVLNIEMSATADRPIVSAIQVFAGNQAPLANAGRDQNMTLGGSVQLAGSAIDYNNDTLTYAWLKTAGPNVALTNADTLTPSFTPTAKGSYTFQLTVNDGKGGSNSDTIAVMITNRTPLAQAGDDQTAQVGQPVQLSGSASSDPDGDTLAYSWQQTGGPAASLSGANSVAPSFTPPAKGSYTFQLTVNDGDTGGSASDSVVINVANRPPTASASADPTIADAGVAVQLNVTASDPDSDPLTYSWQQSGGPQSVTLSNAASASASFTPSAKGVYTFTVTVADTEGGAATATVNVTVLNRAPVANAGTDLALDVGQSAQLNGTTSSDPDSDALSYAWSQTGGATVTIGGATTAQPIFTAPGQPGTLIFQLIVTDSEGLPSPADTVSVVVNELAIGGLGASSNAPTVLGQTTSFTATLITGSNVSYSWDFGDGAGGNGVTLSHTYALAGTYTAIVTASNSLGQVQTEVLVTVTNAQPIAQAGSDQTTNVNTLVNLSGVASSDSDGHLPLSYGWTQTNGMPVGLAGANSAMPSFTAPATPNLLAFSLVVTDSFGLASEADIVLVAINDTAPDAAMLANNGPTGLGQMTTLSASATGSNLQYRWELGDGTLAFTTTTATISHTYAAEGVYIVAVTVTNTTNQTRKAFSGVEVTNQAPNVLVDDVDGLPGSLITLDASASSDPDGHAPLSYSWEQIGGPTVTLSASDTMTTSFSTPNLPNSFTFRLTVTDPYGKAASKLVRVRVQDQRIEGLSIVLGREITPLGQTTVMTALLELGSNVSYTWDFGDGTSATGQVVSHSYALEGSYPAKVTAVNTRNSLIASTFVGVINSPPTANAGIDQVVLIDSLVSLSASASDPEGHGPLSYNWQQLSGPTVSLIGAGTPTVSFSAPSVLATLIFRLTVTDAYGKVATDTVVVEAKEFAAFQTNKIFIPLIFR